MKKLMNYLLACKRWLDFLLCEKITRGILLKYVVCFTFLYENSGRIPMKTMLHFILILVLVTPCFPQTPKKSENVKLNGVETYYEVYGDGEPVFLLHGWGQSTTFWNEYVKDFADNFEVHLVDIKGHGKSAPLQSQFSLQAAVDDFLALLDYLQFDQIKAIGLSYGGELLLQLCSANSHRIKSMITIGAEYDFSGKGLNWKYGDLPPKELEKMRKRHIHGDAQIIALFNLLNNYEIHLTNEQLSKISTSTLIIVGEKDEWFPDLTKIVNLHKHIPDSHLWIVPNKSHIAFSGKNKPEFIRIAKEFLMDEWKQQ